jgi:hypothetical protein
MSSGPRQSLLCPSADPRAQGARIFGVVRRGADTGAHVEYLQVAVPASEDILELAGTASPAEVFRTTAPCAESLCGHFDGRACRLGSRVRQGLPVVDREVPACAIRSACRWFAEHGLEVCLRCAWVVTETAEASAVDATLRWIADPSARPGDGPPSESRRQNCD